MWQPSVHGDAVSFSPSLKSAYGKGQARGKKKKQMEMQKKQGMHKKRRGASSKVGMNGCRREKEEGCQKKERRDGKALIKHPVESGWGGKLGIGIEIELL